MSEFEFWGRLSSASDLLEHHHYVSIPSVMVIFGFLLSNFLFQTSKMKSSDATQPFILARIHENHTIWVMWYESCDMNHIIWSIWYGPYHFIESYPEGFLSTWPFVTIALVFFIKRCYILLGIIICYVDTVTSFDHTDIFSIFLAHLRKLPVT